MQRFNNIVWSPKEYSDAAAVAREAGEDMLARLDWMTIQPKTVLEVGFGVGEASARLAARFEGAAVLTCGLAPALLEYAKNQVALPGYFCSTGENLPLRDHTVDLVFANLVLPWQVDINALLREWQRILTPNGLLMLTALGLDTLQEWRHLFSADEMPQLLDMHDIGDALVQAGLVDPVLDVSHLVLTYRESEQLMREMRATGMWLPMDETQRDTVNTPLAAIPGATLPVTFEVISAHAFAPMLHDEFTQQEDGTVRIPLAHLRRKSRPS